MPRIRVLVVDDAALTRRLLTEVLNRDVELEVAGSAANGRFALAKIATVKPDVVLLDVEMPEMDGLQTLAEMRREHPGIPVVMFSARTRRAAAATLDALALGASDYVPKPGEGKTYGESVEYLQKNLVPKIKASYLAGQRPRFLGASPRVPPKLSPRALPRLSSRVDVLVIGVSTGGPNALTALLPRLPQDLRVPVLIVQHMPPVFTKILAERLNGRCPLQVEEASHGAVVAAGRALIAPGDYHLALAREGTSVVARTHQGPPENSCRPAADVLFRSAAEVYPGTALGVILTGMGQDGLRGCEAIRASGGQILAQDEASSVVWGMPGAIVSAGLADAVLPLDQLAAEILRRCVLREVKTPAPLGHEYKLGVQ
jgi:two-component system, chemotaxis family, protein-glutamate methylesterase/glutaminase